MPHLHLTDLEALFLHELAGEALARQLLTGKNGVDGIDMSFDALDDLTEKLREIAIEDKGGTDKRCLNCSAVITSPNPRKTTCSDSCRQAWSRRMKRAVAKAAA